MFIRSAVMIFLGLLLPFNANSNNKLLYDPSDTGLSTKIEELKQRAAAFQRKDDNLIAQMEEIQRYNSDKRPSEPIKRIDPEMLNALERKNHRKTNTCLSDDPYKKLNDAVHNDCGINLAYDTCLDNYSLIERKVTKSTNDKNEIFINLEKKGAIDNLKTLRNQLANDVDFAYNKNTLCSDVIPNTIGNTTCLDTLNNVFDDYLTDLYSRHCTPDNIDNQLKIFFRTMNNPNTSPILKIQKLTTSHFETRIFEANLAKMWGDLDQYIKEWAELQRAPLRVDKSPAPSPKAFRNPAKTSGAQ